MEKPKAALLDRIEERAREALPLWQCLFVVGLAGLPILLGFGYAALAERSVWRLPSHEYETVIHVQGVAAIVLFLVGVMDIKMGWSRKLFRIPEPHSLPSGPFCLGFAFIEVYYRPWWGVPLGVLGTIFLFHLIDDDEPAITVSRVFWNSRELYGWFFAAVLTVMGTIFLLGLVVQQRLRQRDRAA